MKKLSVFLLTASFLFFLASCSEDDLSYFQNNDPEPEFSLFNILDDYPALKSAFDPIDQRKFNNLLAGAINNNLDESTDVLDVVDDLLLDPGKPVTKMIRSLNNVLSHVINQDELDRDPYKKLLKNSGFTDDFYGFYDTISDNNITFSENLIPILQKSISYFKDTYQGEELENLMTDFVDYIRDDEPYLWRDNENELFQDIAKLFFQANEFIWLDKNGRLITERSKIAKDGVINTGVGNAVRGMDALLSAVNEILKDDALRDIIYDILRDAGNIFGVTVNGNSLKELIMGTIRNGRKYITPGGEEYEKWEEFIWPEFNPYSGFGNEGGVKTDNKHRISSNCDINALTNDILMGCQRLLLRSDRKDSVLKDNSGEKVYMLDMVAKNIRRLGYNPDDPNSSAAHSEEGFYDLLRFDEFGRDRVTDHYDPDNYDPATEPFPQSALDHLLFLAINATTMGWSDGPTDQLPSPSPNENHGTVELTGNLSLSNIFNTLGTNRLLGLNFYDLAFNINNGDDIYRSRDYYDLEDKEKYHFYYDHEYPFFGMLSGKLTSDYGIPQGGNTDGNPSDATREELLNKYFPYDPIGLGNNDLAGWLLGTLCRCAWRGEGPYYSKEGMTQEGDVYTYYSPSGNIYAQVTKPDPEDPLTWEYKYPAGNKDVPGKAKFLSDIDLLPHDDFEGAELDNKATVNITIDDTALDITFEAGIWSQYEVIDKLNEEINAAFGFGGDDPDLVWPAGKGFRINGMNKTSSEGKIIISDVSGDGVSKLFKTRGGIIKEFAGRENRYYERWDTDYFLSSYTPFSPIPLLTKEQYCVAEDMSGNTKRANNVVVTELIPEKSIDRECGSYEESMYRNWQWFLADMKLYLAIPLYLKIGGPALKELLTHIFKENAIPINYYIPDTALINLPVYLAVDCVGAIGLMNIRIIESEPGKPGWNRWGKDGGYGHSEIPGDWRLDVRLPEQIVAPWLQKIIDPIIETISPGLVPGGESMGLHKFAMTVVWDGIPILPGLLQNSKPVPPTVNHSLAALYRLGFLRSKTEIEYPEDSPSLNDGDLALGSRQGALRTRSSYGFEANDSDSNWRNRNSFMPLLVMILVGLHEYSEFDYNIFDPLKAGSGIVKNPVQSILESLFAMLSKPPSQYYEKDHPDCLYPHNAFKARIFGGALKDGHPYGERYYTKGENSKPDRSTYFYTRTDDIAGSDRKSPFGGWQERNFYRMADTRDLISILSDTDPYAENPKRCDGLLPILFHYDVSNDTCDPDNVTNTRLLSNAMRLLYTLGGPEYDDPPEYNDEDYTTWGVRRKLFYGLEQFITTIKLEKGELTAINENNYKNIVPPDWMFSKDAHGNPLPARSEDVLYKAVGYPKPPGTENDEDWNNCFKFIDTLADLISNKGKNSGKYNFMENLISLIDKIFNEVDLSEKNIRGLRHTIGSILTRYNKIDRGWEYPDDLLHVLETELPEILEIFRGRYGNLLVLGDAVMNSNANEKSFLEYFMKNLKSEYPTKDVIEQLHDFLGTDLVARHDSALWTDLAELLISFVEMIETDESNGWFEKDGAFLSNKAAQEIDPFSAMGELLSW